MANCRTIARRISRHTGLEPRQTEKIIANYFLVLAAAAKTGAGMGRLGHISYREDLEARPDLGLDPLMFGASEGLLRAAKRGTVPPRVRHLIDED
ncbi:hypothetical protein JXA47_10470 [Candidatus Sumerlaeota bacterium]|nr:hypothetical protein [Candidatus Sumerlaeota bacterium]